MSYAAKPPENSSFVEPPEKKWKSLSFTSTLYLCPIIDTLLETAPTTLHDELRLGLQEALVNASKHGNQLDPRKTVSVRYTRSNGYYCWVVADQGSGFREPIDCTCPPVDLCVDAAISECGRGLYILHQVFDQVRWSNNGKEVHLIKQMGPAASQFISPLYFLKLIESWWRRWAPTSAHSV